MPPGISKAEALARHVVQALSTVSGGRQQAWRSMGELTDPIAGAEAAVQITGRLQPRPAQHIGGGLVISHLIPFGRLP